MRGPSARAVSASVETLIAWQHSVSMTWVLGLAGADEARVGTGTATTRVEVDACR